MHCERLISYTAAKRSPAEIRFSGVFSAATTRMQSAGQAAAHSEQPTHFSSPVSSKRWSLWRPRKRGYTGTFSSGYWTVTGPSTMRMNVVLRPRSVSPNARYAPPAPPGSGPRWTSTTSSPGLQVIGPPASVRRHHENRRDKRIQGCHGQQDLPPEAHQLVVAQARHRRPDPDEQDDEEEHLDEDHEGVDPSGRVDPEGQQPPAEEHRGGDARDHEH